MSHTREVVHWRNGTLVCPNHGCPLEGIGFPPPRKGEGICPVSKAHFAYEAEGEDDKSDIGKDKFGNVAKIKRWKIIGND